MINTKGEITNVRFRNDIDIFTSGIIWTTSGLDMVTDFYRQRLVKTVMNATKQGYKPMTNKQDLSIYDQGLTDGYYKRFFNPDYNWTKEEKDLYKAGFDKAREY